MSIHHLQIWVPDLSRAVKSWGWLLGELGYVDDRQWDSGRVWRDDSCAIVIERSPDMVPGMLHSRLRPGMNHVAFRVEDTGHLAAIVEQADAHGWTSLGDHVHHPVKGDPVIAFLEDRDGFEVELIAPSD